MLRTHNCNELSLDQIGAKVTLTGWVDTIRDHGGVIFLDLRDHYGVTQVVLSSDSLLDGVTRETVVSVSGTVTKRDEDTVNPKLATGLVEVRVGPCRLALPFEPAHSTDTREDVRLKYRFLDLRNPDIHNNIILRANVLSFLRKQMEALGFLAKLKHRADK